LTIEGDRATLEAVQRLRVRYGAARRIFSRRVRSAESMAGGADGEGWHQLKGGPTLQLA
jgi:hypothetical protein